MCIWVRASVTMGAMNKRELAKAVAVQSDVELKTVVNVIEGFTDVVTAVVAKGEPISIPGFAKFVKVDRPARMGRNPATGEAIRIKASKKARITPVKAFKDAVLAPAKAPKLVRGAFPTDDAAVAAAGKVAAPAAAKRAPAKKAPARKAPARKAAGHEGAGSQDLGPPDRQAVAQQAGPRPVDPARTARSPWTSRWRTARSLNRTPTGCLPTRPGTRESSTPTTSRCVPVPTPTSTPRRAWSS